MYKKSSAVQGMCYARTVSLSGLQYYSTTWPALSLHYLVGDLVNRGGGQILAWPALPEIQYDEVMGQLLAQPALAYHYIVVD